MTDFSSNDPPGGPLDTQTRAVFALLRRWLFWPYPGAIAVFCAVYLITQWVAFIGAALFVAVLYGGWGIIQHAATLREWALKAYMATIKRVIDKAYELLTGARPYQFPGQKEAHEDLARERAISVGLMARADRSDPTQARMATEIEHDAESRLAVLLGKPQLTLAEKGERDAIQAALQARRQSFDVQPAMAAPRPLLGLPLAAAGFSLQPYLIGAVAVVSVGGWAGTFIQTQRLHHAKHDLAAAREEAHTYRSAYGREADARREEQAQSLEENQRSVALAQEREALRARLAARQRSQRDADNAARNSGLGVDFDQRLRDLRALPFGNFGSAPATDSTSGMSSGAGGASGVPAAADPGTDRNGSGAGDSH
jgi:hypothetical protein